MSLDRLDAFRRSVSFKWWLIYDVLIAAGMIVLFRSLQGWAVLLPLALAGALAFSAALDVIEFFVKRRMERDVDEFLARFLAASRSCADESGGKRMKVGQDNVNRRIMEKSLELMDLHGDGELRYSGSKGAHVLRCGMQAGQFERHFAIDRNGKHAELSVR